jgi:opacity protein-like surface antigen
MKNTIALTTAALLLSVVATAQDVPKIETFAGFTYVRANSESNIPAFSANGGSGQFVVNFGKWVGAVADFGAVHNGNIGGYHLDSTFVNYLFGPRIPIRKWSRITPYAQILFGGVRASSSALIQVPEDAVPPPLVQPISGSLAPREGRAVTARAATSQTAFAMTLGGGLDIKISKYVTFRPIGLDWYMTRLQNLRTLDDKNQDNIRYTAGLNFTFGAQ